jgi:hypothetical protein
MDPLAVIRTLGGLIGYVHAKDARVEPYNLAVQGSLDLQPGKPVRDLVWAYRTLGYGHGAQFWADFVSALRSVGYDGVLSIEHEDPLMDAEEAIGRAVELLRTRRSSGRPRGAGAPPPLRNAAAWESKHEEFWKPGSLPASGQMIRRQFLRNSLGTVAAAAGIHTLSSCGGTKSSGGRGLITFGSYADPALDTLKDVLLPEFEKATGIRTEWVEADFSGWLQKALNDGQTKAGHSISM